MRTPQTPYELRLCCRDWPIPAVREAVLHVIAWNDHTGAQTQALAGLIAAWLLEEDESEAPPLNAVAVQEIWRELLRKRL